MFCSPSEWVFQNVALMSTVVFGVADDVVEVASLPERTARRVEGAVDFNGGDGFEYPQDVGQGELVCWLSGRRGPGEPGPYKAEDAVEVVGHDDVFIQR